LPAPAECIPAIADAVKGRLSILADSGVRRGTDVLKYLALGAEAVLLGRLPLWGLAAEGEAGAEAVVRMVLREMDTAMAFLGADRISVLRGDAKPAVLAGSEHAACQARLLADKKPGVLR
jgi:L-lactate dehydrogenase (cytochrome)